MRRRIIALALCLALAASGCTSLLERDYLSTAPHEAVSAGGGTTSALRVENYQDLVNAVLYLVSGGSEHGVLNLYNYTRDVESDLAAACLEVVQEDPLGAYAVDYIRHDSALIVSYYEANIYITYRRTPEQVASITSVTGSSAIRRELRKTLSGFLQEAVLRVSYFAEDEDYIRELVQQTYYDTPAAALGMPEVEITLYPDSGVQRIVEIGLTWPEPAETLREKSRILGETAAELLPAPADAQAVFELLTQSVLPAAEGNTAYDALVRGAADSEGTALACQLLCSLAGVTCTVVQGTLDGAPHCWNIVTEEGHAVHMDAYAQLFGLSDGALREAGDYQWDASAYPICPEPAPAEELQENSENFQN